MTLEEFIDYIEKRTTPYTFRETGRASLSELFRKYPEELLLECIDIGIKQYFHYDNQGTLTKESVETFLDKLGGIAYNKSRNPIDQELNHIKHYCQKSYPYWNDTQGDDILYRYVQALCSVGWNEKRILQDLQKEVKHVCQTSRNWTQWSDTMEGWINDIYNWNKQDDITIDQSGTVLPSALFDNLSSNIQKVCQQINASYEKNLYDCTAVMMRRLLEGLLVLMFQNYNLESEITENNGWHSALDKIIKKAIQNPAFTLSANTKRDMPLFKDIGNYSAHKIWYNSTKQDIEPHILQYRVVIEELMHKAHLK